VVRIEIERSLESFTRTAPIVVTEHLAALLHQAIHDVRAAALEDRGSSAARADSKRRMRLCALCATRAGRWARAGACRRFAAASAGPLAPFCCRNHSTAPATV
jgi:hypothetical protein